MYITPDKFDVGWYENIPAQKRKKGNQSTSQKYYYKDIITAFDIETTYIKEIDNSVMYIWQWQLGNNCTVVGRTWYEFKRFIKTLMDHMDKDEKLVVYVHNLSFEFLFLSGILEFLPDDVFAVERRKVLKATYKGKIEFRCSYLQTNMSLRAFCEKMGVKSYKLKMNYKKRRYWYTDLSQKEMAYCLNDVRGLVEAISKELERDGDNLYTIPLTSTGYARRDAKKAMRKVSKSYITNQLPSYRLYKLLKQAFRGGNCHASRYYSTQIIDNVKSVDISSCYPDAICNELYPVSKFFFVKDPTKEDIDKFVFEKKKACLIRCSLLNVRLKDDLIPVPYLAAGKCYSVLNGVYDNGRILSADAIGCTTFTDIDYKILISQYNFDIVVLDLAYARYGKLPPSYIKTVIEYYQNKTDLKDKPTDEEHTAEFYALLYNKFKNLLNSLYGLMAQDPVKINIQYVDELELFQEDPEADPEEILKEHNKRAFLLYQWGVWVCCWGRYHLQQGIDACGEGFIYCDTDSCKYVGEVDWDKLNVERKKKSEQNKTYATDPNGKKHYMGLFEYEGEYKKFLTMGAKKYAYVDQEDKLHITIAGVNKKIGAIELKRAGGLSAMKEGFVFKYAGGLEARYQDYPEVYEYITEDNVPIPITRNVSLVENTKTLGLTDEYRQLIYSIRRNNVDI